MRRRVAVQEAYLSRIVKSIRKLSPAMAQPQPQPQAVLSGGVSCGLRSWGRWEYLRRRSRKRHLPGLRQCAGFPLPCCVLLCLAAPAPGRAMQRDLRSCLGFSIKIPPRSPQPARRSRFELALQDKRPDATRALPARVYWQIAAGIIPSLEGPFARGSQPLYWPIPLVSTSA